MGHKTLGGSWGRVKEMGVGWGYDHGQLYGSIKWEGENVLAVHDQGGLGRCKVRTPHSHEGLGA
jgi:hypothetical protein